MENVEEEALFVDENGAPLRFYLHKSIKQPGARMALETKIQRYGGEIVDMDVGSNVILVNPDHPSGDPDKIRHAYKTHSDLELRRVYVEAMSWVKNCVKTGKCIHYFFQKGMGGAVRNRDRERTAFSEDDDYHLVEYLATLIPDKSDGGRLGNNIYKSLMENHEALPEEYGWVLRHTWQSWRERYKKRQGWFDERITELAAELKPTPHQKYHLSRKPARYFASHRAGYEMYREEEEEEEEDELEEEPVRRTSGSESPRSADGIQGEDEEEDELEEETLIQKRPLSRSESRRATKRMRIDSTPPPPLLDLDGAQDAQDVGAVSKGKEKALPEDDEDVE
ncbi:hypothetical protein DFH08DRAFT_702737 [Mycena albidolilacea]|uniref:DNA-binding protein RAP1 n=1 Tax=Mycena albidolilacea TaxID=1033008 RepID=A0AAD7ENQ5_9AGAR|nr:hypothetical protein DFH08DRAFT_702737 [Mycena albidolilacea]